MTNKVMVAQALSIDCGEARIDYLHRSASSGKTTVVFIPGLFAGGWMWAEQSKFVERMGFGTLSISEPFAKLALGSEPIERFRLGLEELLQRHDIAKPLLCGNSIGGLVALDYGVNGSRGSYLVASGIPGIGKVALPGIELHRTPSDDDMQVMLEGIFHDHSHIKPYMIGLAKSCFETAHFKNLLKYLLAVRRYPVVESINRLESRTSLIWGEEDRITPTALWEQTFRSAICSGDLEFVKVARCGHSPMLEDAASFNRHLETVLARWFGRPLSEDARGSSALVKHLAGGVIAA